jgi:hypothetical protein
MAATMSFPRRRESTNHKIFASILVFHLYILYSHMIMNKNRYIFFTEIFILLSFAFTVFSLLQHTDFSSGWRTVVLLLLNIAWLLFPCLILLYLFTIKAGTLMNVVCIIFSFSSVILGLYILVDTIYINHDSQSMLVYAIFPFLQTITATILLGVRSVFKEKPKINIA